MNINLLNDYRNEKISFDELAKQNNISRPTLTKYFRKNNLLTNKELKRKNINHNFFEKIDNFEKAYLLGYYIGDGTIYLSKSKYTTVKRLSFSCTREDDELLENVKKLLNLSNKIHRSSKKYSVKNTNYISKPMSNISVTSEKLYDDLTLMGFGNKKTYLEYKSPILSMNNFWKFLLGLFDADGSIAIYDIKKKSNSYINYSLSFTSNSIIFLESIKEILFKNKIKSSIQKDKNSFRLSINSKSSIIKIRDMFYYNFNLGLNRKKEKLLKII